MRQDAGFEEGVELALDELRQIGPGGGFSFGEEGRGMLLHQAVQRGLFRAVALAVNRGAIRCPLGLLHLGLHARLPRLGARTVSSLVLRLNRSACCPPVGALGCGPPTGACVRVRQAASGRRVEQIGCR